MKSLLVIIGILAFISCATRPQYVSPPRIITTVTEQVVNMPALNKKNEVTVGDSLYAEAIKVQSQQVNVTLQSGGKASLDNGHNLSVDEGQTGMLYTLKNMYPTYCDGLFAANSGKGMFGNKANSCIVDFNNDGTFEKAMFSNYDRYFTLLPEVRYSKTPAAVKVTLKEAPFRREAIFQGVSNNAVKIMFREFNNNMIRDAFTQNITYEIDASGKTMIAFKGFKAEVHKVTGTTLVYSVLSPFDK